MTHERIDQDCEIHISGHPTNRYEYRNSLSWKVLPMGGSFYGPPRSRWWNPDDPQIPMILRCVLLQKNEKKNAAEISWLVVVYPPLRKIWVRQLRDDESFPILMENSIDGNQLPPTSQGRNPTAVSPRSSHWSRHPPGPLVTPFSRSPVPRSPGQWTEDSTRGHPSDS